MKTHVAVIVLLFSFAGLAASGHAAQENRATPLSQGGAQRSESGSKRQMNQPAEMRTAKSTETLSPDQAQSRQQTLSPNLEKSLVGLTEAVTKLVDKQGEKESSFSKGFKYVIEGLTALVSIFGCILGYQTFSKLPWFEQNKKLIGTFLSAVLLVVVLGLVSGLITAALYLLFGFIMLAVALLIAAAHLLTFIDRNPELKARVRPHFPELFGDSQPSKPPSSGEAPCAAPTLPGSGSG